MTTVALFLPGWVGDVVMATPAIRALRRFFHDARIIGVLKPYVAEVVAGSDWFDAFVPLERTWATGWKLRRERLDLAVLFPNSFRSALIAWLAGSTRQVGYRRHGRGLLLSDPLEPERYADGTLRISPIIDAYNRLAEYVGCAPPGHEMELFTLPEDEARAEAVWDRAGLYRYPEVVLLNPGAAFGASKYWPAEYFAQLARDLAARRQCGVLVLCGPKERELASRIAAQAADPAVQALSDLQVSVSLGLTKALVRRCDLLVTTDSGPRHFAAAFDRPVVTLFGPTHIAWTETYHPRAIHLQKKVECGPCQQRVCRTDHRCMKTLLPAEVLIAAEDLLHGKG
ncbi:MAG: lipopolysaccharide heptosyltransferase II [Gemmataceae bacterium]